MVFKCARNLLIFLNAFFIMIGLSLTASGAYLLTIVGKYGDIPGAPAKTAIHATIGLGVVILFLSCLGMRGADLRKTSGTEAKGVCYLTIYAAILFVVIAAEVIIGVVVWTWVGGSLGPVQDRVDNSQRATGIAKKSAAQADNFMRCMYNECCLTMAELNYSTFEQEQCRLNSKNMPHTSGDVQPKKNCTPPCSARDSVAFVCSTLEDEDALDAGTCQEGIGAFKKKVGILLHSNIMPIAYICIGVGGLQFLLLLLAITNICWCCGKSEPKIEDESWDEDYNGVI